MTGQGNKNALKHGGEAALKALHAGKPLAGLAYEAEQAVKAEIQAGGVEQIVKRDAIQLQAIADLFLSAVHKAAQEGDIPALDRYVARYGWLAGVSLRAWQQVTANDRAKTNAGPRVVDVIQAMKGQNE